VDPDGRPVSGTKASGLTDLFSGSTIEQDSPTIEVHALDPSRPRRVTITHDDRKLVGSVDLNGDETGPLTVRLQRSGTVAGRIVDEYGQPRGSLGLINLGGIDPELPADRGILPESSSNTVGRDGRFRIEGLIPGLKYGAAARRGDRYLGEIFKDMTVAPGELKDLGELKIIPPR
jgi:hypothetical protein